MAKKKAKSTAASTPAPDVDENAMAIDKSEVRPIEATPEPDPLKDPWTDEQETSLFKGIMKWKPCGVHKHFRMISLANYLRSHGYDPEVDQHTRIPGIWAKLRTMYQLDTLDLREHAFGWDNVEADANKYLEFKLPQDDYGQEQFMRGKRSASEVSSSPPRLGRSPSPSGPKKRKRGETITRKNRASTVDDTDEPRTSPTNSPSLKPARTGRSTNRGRGRSKADSSSRAPSKDTTMEEEETEGTEEPAEEEEDEDGDGDGTASPKPSKGKSKAGSANTRKSKRKR